MGDQQHGDAPPPTDAAEDVPVADVKEEEEEEEEDSDSEQEFRVDKFTVLQHRSDDDDDDDEDEEEEEVDDMQVDRPDGSSLNKSANKEDKEASNDGNAGDESLANISAEMEQIKPDACDKKSEQLEQEVTIQSAASQTQ